MTTNIDAANQTLHSNTTDPPNVDDRVHVKWTRGKDGQHHTAEDEIPLSLPAKIVERRALGKKRLHPSALANLNANELDYYVHFIGHDRRLDQWVKIDDLELETLERVDPQEQQILHSTADVAAAAAADNNSNQDEQELVTVGGGNWHGGGAHQLEKEHEEATKVKNIENIIMGSYEVEAWYYSPYPEEYSNLKTIYVCEFCLSYMRKSRTYVKHKEQCACRHPPGTEIYRHEDIAVYELDGKDHKAYCQKLCLLAKLFLDHKTLYFDVTPFYFYVITKVDCHGAHIVGYFSKEKVSEQGYNLACILTLPQYQKAGYGKFIISLSYELSKREGKTGSPEKPLSDLGKLSYKSYWEHVLMHLLAEYDFTKNIQIPEISEQTGIKQEDIIYTLHSLGMMKVWKGLHVVHVQQEAINDYMKLKKHFRLCHPEYLNWEPPVLAESN